MGSAKKGRLALEYSGRTVTRPSYKRRVARSLEFGEWRPYSEAPRNGTPLLVRFKDRTIVNAAFLVPGFPLLSLLPWDIYGHRLGSQYEDELPVEFRPFLPDEDEPPPVSV